MSSENNQGLEKTNLQDLLKTATSMASDENQFVRRTNGRLYGEIGELAKYLNEMMKKMGSAELSMGQTADDIPRTADQLDEIIRLTEEGTHRVMGHAEDVMNNQAVLIERIDALKGKKTHDLEKVGEIKKLVEENQNKMMDLFTALEFQDIAGQRLQKVASLMKEIQSRILKLVVSFGLESTQSNGSEDKQKVLLKELDELTSAERLDQNLIDDVLAEFGF
ncbi:MAG: protein phosphatase CheZ [Nitrospiria bacterium]